MEEKFRRGPNPLEFPQIGDEWIPGYLRFRPGDENRFWMIDVMHMPQPMRPLEYGTIHFVTFYGINYAFALFTPPTSYSNMWRTLNGWHYFSPMAVTDPEEIKQRAANFMEKIGYHFANWEKIWTEAQKNMTEWLDWFETFNYEKDPDLSDPEQMHHLYGYFDGIIDRMCKISLHHWIGLITTQSQVVMYRALAKELVPGTTDADCDDMLQGFGNKIMETDVAFWKLGELAYSLGVGEIVKDAPLDEVLSRLQKTDNGKKWLEELKKEVLEYGMRHVGGCVAIAAPSWPEDLTYPISFIRGPMDKKQRGQKLIPKEELVAKREKAVKGFRAKIRSEEDKKKFDDALALMQRLYPWIEDHDFFVEGRMNTLVHLKMVELGRRLVTEKYIDEPNDIFYLLVSEVRELFDELMLKHAQGRHYNLINVRPLIKKRKEDFQKQSEWSYPTVLGVIPKEAPTEPVAVLIYGATPENIERAMASAEKVEQVTEFNGLPGSAGVCEGIARVVIEARDIKEVMPGEILICPFTNPLWNPVFTKIKGVVTDTGGSLCHTVIIAREYGIPAVCGTGYGTKVIKTGDKIRVDGTKGLITKL